jgi:hypothetical protein
MEVSTVAADPARLEQYANRLEEKAGSRVTFSAAAGLVVGGALGATAALLPHLLHVHSAIKHEFVFAVPLLGAVGGAYLGYLIGQSRAVSLRLQAGLAVHQLEMERMLFRIEAVRPQVPVSATVALPQAQAPVALPAPFIAPLAAGPAPAVPAPPVPPVPPAAPAPPLPSVAQPAPPVAPQPLPVEPPPAPAPAPAPAPVMPPVVVASAPAPQMPPVYPAPAPVVEVHAFQPPAPLPAPQVIPMSAPAPVPAPQLAPEPQPEPQLEAAPAVSIAPPTFEWQTPSSGTGA